MKNAFRLILATAIICAGIIIWQSKEEVFSPLDEGISYFTTFVTDGFEKPLDEKPDIRNFYQGDFFQIDQYLNELGFFKVPFPKKNGTLAVFRHYKKKITLKNDGTIICEIYKDKNKNGIKTEIQKTYGPYFISYGDGHAKERTDSLKILEITTLFFNLRNFDTISEVDKKTNNEIDAYYQKILDSSPQGELFRAKYVIICKNK